MAPPPPRRAGPHPAGAQENPLLLRLLTELKGHVGDNLDQPWRANRADVVLAVRALIGNSTQAATRSGLGYQGGWSAGKKVQVLACLNAFRSRSPAAEQLVHEVLDHRNIRSNAAWSWLDPARRGAAIPPLHPAPVQFGPIAPPPAPAGPMAGPPPGYSGMASSAGAVAAGFTAAPAFAGARLGFVFRRGLFGLGYYDDTAAVQQGPANQPAGAAPCGRMSPAVRLMLQAYELGGGGVPGPAANQVFQQNADNDAD